MIAVWELHDLRRGTLSLEEFIAKLRILVKEANYPVDHRFLSDILVLGMNSECVRKKCFKEGNTLAFNIARQMAKTEESADKQIQLMNTEVHLINSNKRFLHQRYQPRNNAGTNPSKAQHCKNCGMRSPLSRTVPGKKCNMPLLPKVWAPS